MTNKFSLMNFYCEKFESIISQVPIIRQVGLFALFFFHEILDVHKFSCLMVLLITFRGESDSDNDI